MEQVGVRIAVRLRSDDRKDGDGNEGSSFIYRRALHMSLEWDMSYFYLVIQNSFLRPVMTNCPFMMLETSPGSCFSKSDQYYQDARGGACLYCSLFPVLIKWCPFLSPQGRVYEDCPAHTYVHFGRRGWFSQLHQTARTLFGIE